MMWYYGPGGALWMSVLSTLTMLAFVGGLAVLIGWTVTALRRQRGGGEPAEEILKRRLAAGEISPEDYERTRRILGI